MQKFDTLEKIVDFLIKNDFAGDVWSVKGYDLILGNLEDGEYIIFPFVALLNNPLKNGGRGFAVTNRRIIMAYVQNPMSNDLDYAEISAITDIRILNKQGFKSIGIGLGTIGISTTGESFTIKTNIGKVERLYKYLCDAVNKAKATPDNRTQEAIHKRFLKEDNRYGMSGMIGMYSGMDRGNGIGMGTRYTVLDKIEKDTLSDNSGRSIVLKRIFSEISPMWRNNITMRNLITRDVDERFEKLSPEDAANPSVWNKMVDEIKAKIEDNDTVDKNRKAVKKEETPVQLSKDTRSTDTRSADTRSVVEQLKEMKELLDLGIVSQEEFNKKKKELLGL